jgi:hypothetical protein
MHLRLSPTLPRSRHLAQDGSQSMHTLLGLPSEVVPSRQLDSQTPPWSFSLLKYCALISSVFLSQQDVQTWGSSARHVRHGNIQFSSGINTLLPSASILYFVSGSAYVLIEKPVPTLFVSGFLTSFNRIVTGPLQPSTPLSAKAPLIRIVRAVSSIVHVSLNDLFV